MTHTGCRQDFGFALHQQRPFPKADLRKCNNVEPSNRREDQIADLRFYEKTVQL